MISIRNIITAIMTVILAQAVPASASIIHLLGPLIYRTGLIVAPAISVSILNGPLIAVNQGPFPEIIAKYTDYINSTDTATDQIDGLVFYTEGGDVPDEVTYYYQMLAGNQISLLNLLRDKAALFTLLPIIGQPITALLRDGQRATDALGAKIVDAVNSDEYAGLNTQIVTSRAAINAAYARTIQSYDGLIGLKKREGGHQDEQKAKREVRMFIA
ncbi:hypothetical protein QBC43DRAFT_306288 [Cladorrhinum sp. PSN259]|nr:hypothetical protein QBC43DRAFT_306288 [Cladorrhinum sp. PSN259]